MQSIGHGRAHTLGIVQHLVVPEPQHAVPLGFEEPGPGCFRRGRAIVLPAIDLDDQSCCVADEIGDEPADRHLSAKPIAFGLPRPQHLPEPLFGFGHVTAEGTGALARTGARRFLHHGSVLAITPTSTLPHRGGGCDRLPARTVEKLITCSTSLVAVWYSRASSRSAVCSTSICSSAATLSLRSMCVSSGMISCLPAARDDTLPPAALPAEVQDHRGRISRFARSTPSPRTPTVFTYTQRRSRPLDGGGLGWG